MRKILILLTFLHFVLYTDAQIFQQTFNTGLTAFANSSSSDATYVNTSSPSINQFTQLQSTSSSCSISVPTSGSYANKLYINRTSGTGIFARNGTGGSFTGVSALQVKFDLDVINFGSTSNTGITFQVGDGFSNSVNSAEATTLVHSFFAIRLDNTTTKAYKLRNASGTNTTNSYTGSTSITFVTNNSGATITYTGPDNNSYSLADDKYDLWANTTREFTAQSATTATQALKNFKMTLVQGEVTFDNLIITDLSPQLATTYYYVGNANDNLNNLSKWNTSQAGTGSSPTSFSSSNQYFQINTPTTITNTGSWSVLGSNSKIILGDAGVSAVTLTDNGGISGPMDVSAASSGSNHLILNTATIPSFLTLNPSSTVTYSSSVAQTVAAATYGTLNLNNTHTSGATSGGNITIATAATVGASALFNNASGHTFTVNASKTLTVNGTFANTGTLTISGTATVANGGTYRHAQNSTGLPTFSWSTGSTCEITGMTSSTPASSFNQNFHHFIWNCAGQSGTINISGNLATVNGNLEIRNTNSQTLRFTGGTAVTLNIKGDFVVGANNGVSVVEISNGSGNPVLNVDGDVTIGGNANAATLRSANPATIKIKGDWQNLANGTFTPANITVELNGTVDQSISKTGGETFNNLTINKASGNVTPGSAITVSGTLNMTSGKIVLGSNQLNATGSITSASSSSYIVTDGSGGLKINAVAATAKIFPVGISTSSYNPITITNAGTSDHFTVRVKNSLSGTPADATKLVNAEWVIAEDVAGGSDLTLLAQWNATNQAGSFNPAGSVVIGSYESGAWTEKAATIAGSDPYTATASGITSFSNVGVGNTNAFLALIATPSVTTNVVSSVTDTSASTGGNVVAEGTSNVTERGIVYSDVNTTPTIADNKVIHTTGTPPANTTGSGAYSIDLSALSAATTYYVRAYASNSSGEGYGTVRNFTTTAATPTLQASSVTFSSVTGTSFVINFNAGDGANRMVLVKAGSAVDAIPVDRSTYTANANFGSGTQIGTGNYVVYAGNGTSVTVTGLSSGSTYHVAVLEYNGTAGIENYLTDAPDVPAIGSQITATLYFKAAATGNWNETTTWLQSSSATGPWVAATTVPGEGSGSINIGGDGTDYTVTVAASVSARLLTIASGSRLNVSASQTLTIVNDGTSDIDLNLNGYLRNQGTVTLSSGATMAVTGSTGTNGTYEHAVNGGTIPLATWNNASTCLVTGITSSTSTSGLNQNFYHFTWNCTGQTASSNLGMFNNTISGDFRFVSSGSASAELGLSNSNAGTGSGTITINGDFIVEAAASNILAAHRSGSTGSQTALSVNIAGDFILTSGTFRIVANAGIPSTWNLSGNYSQTGGTFNSSNANSSFRFAKNGEQSYSKSGGTFGGGIITVLSGSILNTGTNVIDGSVAFNLNSGATLKTAHTGGVNGTLTTSGTKTLDVAAKYIFNGSSAQVTGALLTTADDVTVDNAAGVTLSAATTINGTLTVNSGALTTGANNLSLGASADAVIAPLGALVISGGTTNFNARPVVFQSSSTGTARLGQVSGTLNGATNVTVERFIGIPTAKRAWRMLTVPLRSTTTDVSIFDSWQEGGAQITGYGTLVTGTNANTSTNGLDVTSGASIRSFVNGAWADVTNTKTTSLFTTATSAANKSFAVFVRGDRSNLTSTSGTSTTVLRATGTLQTGDQTFDISSTAESYTLVGNPYASPLSFHRFKVDNFNNINPGYWFWNPNNSGNGGAYVAVASDFPLVANSQSYTVTNGTAPDARYIQSGMAFFVQTKTGALANTVVFKEAHKSDSTINNVFRTGSQLEKLQVNIQLLNTTTSSWGNVDGFVARYNNNYSAEIFGLEDISKMLNTEENFSLKRNGNLLAIESRPLVDADDTLFVSMSNIKQNRSYKFAFDPQNFDAPGLTAYLEDAFLNNATPVSLSAPTEIVFTTTTAAGSFAADRFRIVFKASSTLSTSGLTVKASLVEKQVRIDWSMVNENNVKGYTVERSSDGKTFTALTAVNAKANDNSTVSYDAMDASPLNGMNYYRIKATDVNGKITYSAIVRIKTNDTKASVTVYPNPVKGEQLNIQLNGLSKGTYTLRLYNNLGQEVYGSNLQVTQTAMSQTLNIAALKTSGVYTLRITNGDQTIEQTIVAQ